MFLINQVSKLSKVSIPNIRLYEKHGLIHGKKKSGVRKSEYTYYDQEMVDRLELIEECRSIGMSIPQIASLVRVWFGVRISNSKRVQILSKQMEILDDKQAKINDIRHRVQILNEEIKKFL